MKKGIKYFIDKISNNHPIVFIDVGAMGGIPLKWKPVLNVMQILAFEPDKRSFAELKSNNTVTYLNYALHSKSEDLKLYVTKGRGTTSIYKPNTDFISQYKDQDRFDVIQEETILSERVKSLDDIFEEQLVKDVDFIKLDTQGSELLILEGGQKRVIPGLFGAQIEAEFAEIYKDQPRFGDVDNFMNKKGFSLIDLRRQYWKKKDYCNYRGRGHLIFADALYFKKIDIFYQDLSVLQDSSRIRSKIFKAISICLIYKMFDYAVAIAKRGHERGCLSDNESKEVILKIKEYSNSPIFPRFSLHSKLYGAMNCMLKKFKPPSYLGWADGDNDIGNIRDI